MRYDILLPWMATYLAKYAYRNVWLFRKASLQCAWFFYLPVYCFQCTVSVIHELHHSWAIAIFSDQILGFRTPVPHTSTSHHILLPLLRTYSQLPVTQILLLYLHTLVRNLILQVRVARHLIVIFILTNVVVRCKNTLRVKQHALCMKYRP